MILHRDSENIRYITSKHSSANYKRILPFIVAVNEQPGKHFRFTSEGFMPLCIEYLEYSFLGYPVYSMTHYYNCNGDAMRDPDMTFYVDRQHGHIIPLTFQQDGVPSVGTLYEEVFDGENRYRKHLATELDDFLALWSKNIIDQGFNPEQARQREAPMEQFAAGITK